MKVPSLSYTEIVKALQRDGWTVVRQRGSHIRLQKRIGDELLKVTVPATSTGQTYNISSYPKTSTLEFRSISRITLINYNPNHYCAIPGLT